MIGGFAIRASGRVVTIALRAAPRSVRCTGGARVTHVRRRARSSVGDPPVDVVFELEGAEASLTGSKVAELSGDFVDRNYD